MTPEEIEFLKSETKIIVPIDIPSAMERGCQFGFATVAADMDRLDRSHVFEGTIRITKVTEVDPDPERFGAFREVFGQAAWEKAVQGGAFRSFTGNIRLEATRKGQHHECNKTVAEAVRSVVEYPTNQKRLIIQTIRDGWEIGTTLMVMETVAKKMKPPGA